MTDPSTPTGPDDAAGDALQAAGTRLKAQQSAATEQILRSATTGEGKYLRVEVPNFNSAPSDAALREKYIAAGMPNASPMGSYLRLGVVPTSLLTKINAYIASADEAATANTAVPPPTGFAKSTGEDLALSVLAFADDARPRCADGSEEEQVGARPNYAADYRTPTERYRQSGTLHTLGGWREHTDGNRISTTRGDKVEVIGGNYLLSVRCRDDSNNMESGWDISGGHVSGSTNSRSNRKPPHTAKSTKKDTAATGKKPEKKGLFWSKRSGGTWRSNEGSTKGDSRSFQVGDSHDTLYGHEQIATTGKEAPTVWHEPEDCTTPDTCEANPKIIDATFAEVMQTYTGSEALRVPLVTDTTHVTKMATKTHAETMTSHHTSHTNVTSMNDTTICAGEHNTTTTASAIIDATSAASTDSTTLSDTFDFTLGPVVSASMSTSDSIMLGGTTSIMLGGTADQTMGASGSVTIGLSSEIKLALTLEKNVGAEADIKLIGRLDVGGAVDSSCALALARKSLIAMYGIP